MEKQQEQERKEKIKDRLLNVFIFLTFITLVITVVFTVFKINNPKSNTFLGIKPIIITSESMEPKIMTNALIFGREVKFDTIRVGDIISFEMSNGRLNTHEVVRITNGELWTKGVNNLNEDSQSVTELNFRYKIVSIQNWTSELNTVIGVVKYIIIPILLVIAVLFFFICYLPSRKRKKENFYPKKRKRIKKIFPIAETKVEPIVEREFSKTTLAKQIGENHDEVAELSWIDDLLDEVVLAEDIDIDDLDDINIDHLDLESILLGEHTQ